MSQTRSGDTVFTKSTRSGANGHCVEIARGSDAVTVRDSKNPVSVLRFSHESWRALIAAIRADRLG
ncbi:hypothetical protein GCM10009557_06530 [Virgisporangium ochraceum]|uniref:DUF397 domain-containing protein n=1 Tax=Virgisporangium ochraceum TaxID=65505 RepID=A0A8J4EBL0_9ACTN|nr:hypothetical protein Voc01_008690 [Virgisporangium ochraceum]